MESVKESWEARIAREKAESLVVYAKACEVIQALGYEVKPKENEYGASAAEGISGEKRLWISWGSDCKKFEVSACAPDSISGGRMSFRDWYVIKYDESDPCSIGVSVSKPVDKIVADIKRRLLPVYDELFAKCLEHKAEHQAAADKRVAVAEALDKVAGLRVDRPSNYRDEYSCYQSGICHGKISYDGGVRLELDLPVELAVEVIRLVQSKKVKGE
jgi:hypothetical protein